MTVAEYLLPKTCALVFTIFICGLFIVIFFIAGTTNDKKPNDQENTRDAGENNIHKSKMYFKLKRFDGRQVDHS